MTKLLLVMPYFNSYHIKIRDELERLGFDVTLIRDSSKFVKLVHLKFLSKKLFHFYMQQVWPLLFMFRARGKYDVLLVIKGEELTPRICDKLINNSTLKKSLLYLWDSIAHNPKTEDILKYFNVRLSFDNADCKIDDYQLELFPLFFANEFECADYDNDLPAKYDFCCIGAFKEERVSFLLDIENVFKKKPRSYFFKLYMPWNQYLRKIITIPGFYGKYGRFIFFKKMSLKTVSAIVHESRVVVDVPDKVQSGLTMRTFEALGAKKKLLTTNLNVVCYSFYNSNNIVTDLTKLSDDFVHQSYDDSVDKRDLHSLREWVLEISNKLILR